jgi:hypothetical protein
MRKTILVTALVLAASLAVALDGKDEYAATALFGSEDIEALEEWSAIDVQLGFGNSRWVNQETMSTDSDGVLYLYAWGPDGTGRAFNGIVRYDPATEELDTILFEEYFALADGVTWRDNIDCLTVSPTDAGPLTADDLVLVRNVHDGTTFSLEVTTLDPDDPGGESVLFTASGGGPSRTHLVIGAAGDLFLLDEGAGGIRRFHWSGSSYDESAVTTAGTVRWGLAIGPQGYLYSFDGSTSLPETIVRIDPADLDSCSSYATLENTTYGVNRFRGWGWDAAGTLWIGIEDFEKHAWCSFVTDVPSGGTVRYRDRIAEAKATFIYSLTAGASGRVYVAELVAGEASYTVYELVPDDSGGGKGKDKKK